MIPTLEIDSTIKLTPSKALSLIRKWQRYLRVTHWTIGVSPETPLKEEHDMEIWMTPTRQHAAIRIQPRCWEYSKDKFEKLLIHEILHVLFDPMKREYERSDYQYSVSHFEGVMETTLDQIAHVIYDLK